MMTEMENEINKHPFLYEINTAAWLHELSEECGRIIKLGNVPEEKWDELRDLGFDYIWLMGVWKRSAAGMDIFRKEPEFIPFQLYLKSVFPGWQMNDMIGSPYSVAEYIPDALIGCWDDIDRARKEINKRGMKLILDFVPNHTAPDHPWIYSYPEYYILGNQEDYSKNPLMYSPIRIDGDIRYVVRGKDPYYPPWSDTVQLNYFNPEMRSALLKELVNIAQHCDGMRCDMAMLVMNDFFAKHWDWASKEYIHSMPKHEFWEDVRKTVPDQILIAETYWETEWMLQQIGFDFVYDKRLYDRIKHLSAFDLNLHLRADISYQNKLVRFIENHDEARSASVFSKEQLSVAFLICATVPGMKLFYHGQLEGRKRRTPVQLRRAVPENPDAEIRSLYKKVLTLTGQEVYKTGTWQLKDIHSLVDDSYLNLLAWMWKSEKSLKLIVVNLGNHVVRASIALQDEVQKETEYIFYDEFNDQEYVRKGNKIIENGLLVILDANRCHVFDIKVKCQSQDLSLSGVNATIDCCCNNDKNE
jgi:glycosidase